MRDLTGGLVVENKLTFRQAVDEGQGFGRFVRLVDAVVVALRRIAGVAECG